MRRSKFFLSFLLVTILITFAFFLLSCKKENKTKGNYKKKSYTIIGTRRSGSDASVLISDGQDNSLYFKGEKILNYRIEEINNGYIVLSSVNDRDKRLNFKVGEKIKPLERKM